jgi:4-amino-4-deoxy-L-arabinose transferase-like glycosyltransferase
MQKFHWPSRTSLIHAAFLLAMALPYCINLGKSSIMDANEAFYAETPREMMDTGLYISPLFNYHWRTEKPPLTYYAILISYKLFGINEFAVRFPGALAAIGVLLFSYATARILFSPRAALICAAISATTPRIFIIARRLPIDILLLFFLTGVMFFIVRGILRKDRLSWVLAYLFSALGFLAKGPVTVVIPAAVLILWMLWNRRSDISVYPLEGCLIFACVVLPWYVLSYLEQGWTYITPFIMKENFGRFAATSFGPSRGIFYYFSVFIIDFFPWSFLALAACFSYLWNIRKEAHPLKSLSFGLPLIWCILIFCLFSISINKQEYYIAPIYPAAAVMLSGIIDKSVSQRNQSGHGKRERDPELSMSKAEFRTALFRQLPLWAWPFGLKALILFVLSWPIAFIIPSFMPNATFLQLYAPSLILVTGAALMAWSIVRGKLLHCFSALAVSLWAVLFISTLFYIPALESVRPIKAFCKRLETQLRKDDDVGYFRIAAPSMTFYLRRPIFEESNNARMMGRFQRNKRVFCVMSRKDYSYLKSKGVKLFVLDRRSSFALRFDRTFGEDILLVCNEFPAHSNFSEGSPPL